MPESWPDRRTAMFETGRGRMVLAFPSADGQLQVGMVVPKGGYQALRGRGETVWTEELISKLPAPLAGQLRAHREALDHAGFLNVVCGRLTRWTAPGLLLIGDAAHPMSPVGGQGLNIALRDSLVAANHLCPVLAAGGDDTAIDAAAALVREERWPEIVAVQEMQQKQARIFHANGWKGRLINALLPLLLRTGLLQKLNRQHYHHMSYGVVPVKLTA
jgi:2-polyprenyl-6-methoxyphenol hydroxylase-like FAD-dependent oxidoreductase